MRTLYLHNALAVADGDVASDHRLQEEFCARSSRSLVGRGVLPAEEEGEDRNGPTQGLLSEESVRDLAPNLICMTGGLFADSGGSWKIPWPLLESWIEGGNVLIVTDCGNDEVRRHRDSYHHASRFLRVRPEILPAGSDGDADRDRQIVCDPRDMPVSDWLRPALTGIPEIAVCRPAKVGNWEHIVAAGFAQGSETGALAGAGPDKDPWVFASAGECGTGYVVFIAGEISADDWIQRFPANAQWLANLSELLVAEAQRNCARASSPIQLPFSFLLSGRSVNKQLVVRMGEALLRGGMQAWLDVEYSASSPSSLPAAGRGLDQVTHYVLFWSRACLGAPWVERDLPPAVSMAVERQVPMIVVRLDLAPVPQIIAEFPRIEGLGMSPQELASASVGVARRLERNRV